MPETKIVVFYSMARQAGTHTITGIYGNLCFYQMGDGFYVRMKSSLSGKRVKTDCAFAKTMQHAGMLAAASKIASALYKQLKETEKIKGLFRKLTGEVMGLLQHGLSREEILQQLEIVYLEQKKKQTIRKQQIITGAPLQQHFFLQFLEDNIFTERLAEAEMLFTAAQECPP